MITLSDDNYFIISFFNDNSMTTDFCLVNDNFLSPSSKFGAISYVVVCSMITLSDDNYGILSFFNDNSMTTNFCLVNDNFLNDNFLCDNFQWYHSMISLNDITQW